MFSLTCRFAETHKSSEVDYTIQDSLDEIRIVITDKITSYADIADFM